MKTVKKKNHLAFISLALLSLLFVGIFIWSRMGYVTYYVDKVNTCTPDGLHTGVNGPVETKRVRKIDERKFLIEAERSNTCVRKEKI